MSYQYRYWYESKRDATFTVGLSIMKRMTRIAQTINRFGYTIRGIYGEGSQVYGHTLSSIQPTYTW